jgi:transcription antitermination factor NusG
MMQYGNLKPGDCVPYTPPRGIQHGPETSPTWHALTVPPQRERAAREFLRARDVYAFYPSEERTRFQRGRKITTERPMIAGQVYARFTKPPQWDVMKEKMRLITGVYSLDGWPVEIPPIIIRRLQGMTVEAEKLREAREELLRLRVGDKATVKDGPLGSFAVEITGTRNGRYLWRSLTGVMLGKPISGESVRDMLAKEEEAK